MPPLPAPRRRPGGWGVVLPYKGGAEAKSRLRSPALAEPPLPDPALGDPVLGDLPLAMALDCLRAVLACPLVADVVVVSGDPLARSAAARAGARAVPDPGGGLDAAVATGLGALAEPGALAVVAHRAVLLADLPCLRDGDLRAALVRAGRHTSALVPDADGTGTVLLTGPGGPWAPTRFGPGSALAHERGGAVRLALDLPRLRRDVDTPADLRDAVALGVGPRTAAVLGLRRPDDQRPGVQRPDDEPVGLRRPPEPRG